MRPNTSHNPAVESVEELSELAAGLPDFVTHSIEEYERLANRLVREADLLSDIRRRLARARSGSELFEGERAVRELETAFARMWGELAQGRGSEPVFGAMNTGP
jgi:hypothetical protein